MLIVALVILHLVTICYVPDSHSHTRPFARTDFKDKQCIFPCLPRVLGLVRRQIHNQRNDNYM